MRTMHETVEFNRRFFTFLIAVELIHLIGEIERKPKKKKKLI